MMSKDIHAFIGIPYGFSMEFLLSSMLSHSLTAEALPKQFDPCNQNMFWILEVVSARLHA